MAAAPSSRPNRSDPATADEIKAFCIETPMTFGYALTVAEACFKRHRVVNHEMAPKQWGMRYLVHVPWTIREREDFLDDLRGAVERLDYRCLIQQTGRDQVYHYFELKHSSVMHRYIEYAVEIHPTQPQIRVKLNPQGAILIRP